MAMAMQADALGSLPTPARPDCSLSDWLERDPEALAPDDWLGRRLRAPDRTALGHPLSARSHGPRLTFREHMLEEFDFLVEQRFEPSQQLLEQLAGVLRDRAELERHYGHTLMGMSRGPQLQQQGGSSLHAVVGAVVDGFRKRGEQALSLSQEIEMEVVAMMEQLRAQQRKAVSKMSADVDRMRKQLDQKHRAHEACAERYAAQCSQAEVVAQECLQGISMRSSDRLKLAERAAVLNREARLVEGDYHCSIEEANKAQFIYGTKMPDIMSELQDMDEELGDCLCTGLGKFAGLEESRLRAAQQDVASVVKIHGAADPVADLQEFIHANRSRGKSCERTLYSALPFYASSSASRRDGRRSLSPTRQVSTEASTQQVIASLRPKLQRIFSPEALQPQEQSDLAAQLEQLRRGMPDGTRRAAVVQALVREVLITDEATGVELGGGKPAVVAAAAFDPLVALFEAGLDACDQQNDAWCGRDMMVLAQHICCGGVSLHSRVYNHSLWEKVTFWERALTVGLLEASAAEAVRRRQMIAGTSYFEPYMTVFLQRFVGHMLAFGISFDQGRDFVRKTLQKHSHLLEPHIKTYATLMLSTYEAAVKHSPRNGKAWTLDECDNDDVEVWIMEPDEEPAGDGQAGRERGPRRGRPQRGARTGSRLSGGAASTRPNGGAAGRTGATGAQRGGSRALAPLPPRSPGAPSASTAVTAASAGATPTATSPVPSPPSAARQPGAAAPPEAERRSVTPPGSRGNRARNKQPTPGPRARTQADGVADWLAGRGSQGQTEERQQLGATPITPRAAGGSAPSLPTTPLASAVSSPCFDFETALFPLRPISEPKTPGQWLDDFVT